MGSGASQGQALGVSANPRVVYNEKLSKKENKTTVIDSPVLVDIQHGSVRYRYGSYCGEPADKSRRVERPYEGEEKTSKQHYFYHARLKDFSKDADPMKEDSFKYLYVTKGPARAQQKRLFYVYGRGFDAKDGTRVKPTQTKDEGPDYSWPGLRVANHLYYRLSFNAVMSETTTEEDQTASELMSTPDKSHIRFLLIKEDRTRDLKAKIAVKILKAASDLHVCFQDLELRDEDVVGDYQSEDNRNNTEFEVELHLI